MPTLLNQGVSAIGASIAAAGTYDIRPASPDEWMITSLGASSSTNGIVVSGDVYLTDGVTDILLRRADTVASMARTPQWLKPMRFGLTNARYLKIKNITAGALRFNYSGRVTGVGVTGPMDVKSGISTAIAAGSYVAVQPAAGEDWVLDETGISSAGWIDGGGVDRYYPKLSLRIYDGANEVLVSRGSDWSIFNPFRIVLTNAVYLRIYNEDAVARDIGYIAHRIR